MGLTDIVAIASGNFHHCALSRTGTVKCWGENSDNSLGDTSGLGGSETPVDLGLTDIKAITVGSNHACALTNSGKVKCWGANYSGELGFNSTAALSLTPVDVLNLSNVTEISAKHSRTYAIDAQGITWCWGLHWKDHLPNNANDNSALPVRVPGF